MELAPELDTFILWFLDGRYAVVWGTDPEDAKSRYLAGYPKLIREVVPASNYRNPLPHHLSLPTPPGLSDQTENIHVPLEQPKAPTLHGDISELTAKVEALSKALADSLAPKAEPVPVKDAE